MDDVFELLCDLANRDIRFSLEGNDLNCYAPNGSLTNEIKGCIAQNKPRIIQLLRNSSSISEASIDLDAEAILDPNIQPPSAPIGGVDFTAARSIFLTGASGFLGAYLLRDLILAKEARVYCLVRCRSESEGAQRIKDNLLKYGLWSDDFAPRIVPVPGDLAEPLLGVGPATFDRLAGEADVIYHSGALVNFIYPYANLRASNVRGTEEVIRLACRTKLKPLHHVSTVGIFPPAPTRNTVVFESDPPPRNWCELNAGYRQSKWVAEKMVSIAADRGLPVRIYRPGFVSGDSKTGFWNTDDFLPRLIKGCIQLGSMPDQEAMIDMVPVDYVSKAIVTLSRQRELQSNVFNLVNPRQVPSSELGRLIACLGYKVTVVSYAEWRNALLEDAKTSAKNALYPILMMITETPSDLVPVFDCRQTLAALQGTLVSCPEINRELIATYLGYFRSSGFLDT